MLSSSTLHCTTRGFFLIKAHHCAHPHTALTHRAYQKILLDPPDNKPTLAHSALLSWLCCHLPRQWRLGARVFWFAGSRFELSLITNLRQISHPYYWFTPPKLNTQILFLPHSTNTGVFRHHRLWLWFICADPRQDREPDWHSLLPFPPAPRGDGWTGTRPFPHC